jgi:hypothetical protein
MPKPTAADREVMAAATALAQALAFRRPTPLQLHELGCRLADQADQLAAEAAALASIATLLQVDAAQAAGLVPQALEPER